MSCVSLEEGKITGGMRRSFVEVMAFEFHLKAGQDLECENLPGDYVGGIYLNELIYKTERDRRRKQIYGYQRGKGGGIN